MKYEPTNSLLSKKCGYKIQIFKALKFEIKGGQTIYESNKETKNE